MRLNIKGNSRVRKLFLSKMIERVEFQGQANQSGVFSSQNMKEDTSYRKKISFRFLHIKEKQGHGK